ncbi:MAG: hypothetical protein KGK08_07355 [Acidobacteriota bacterium]|nr:hypothetical protein [Acidobacteriota bacterium]
MFWIERVFLWLSEHVLPLILVLCLTVLASVFYYLAYTRKVASALLRGEATPVPAAGGYPPPHRVVASSAAAHDLDPEVLRAAHVYLHQTRGVGQLVPPAARLTEEIGLSASEIRAAAAELVQSCGRKAPAADLPILVTLADLVRYVQSAPLRRK